MEGSYLKTMQMNFKGEKESIFHILIVTLRLRT